MLRPRLRRASSPPLNGLTLDTVSIEKCQQLIPPWKAAQGTAAAPTCAAGERPQVGPQP
jgi:hypothetical protein